MNKTYVLTIQNQKGGVGKTSITSNLAWALKEKGKKVLVIDNDSQGSLSGIMNVKNNSEGYLDNGLDQLYVSVYDAIANNETFNEVTESGETILIPHLSKELLDEYIRDTTYPTMGIVDGKTTRINKSHGIDIIPCDIALADLELELNGQQNGGLYLYYIVKNIERHYDYDFILIDNAPSLGMLVYNSLAAASSGGVIIPINCEVMTIRGAENLIKKVADVQRNLPSGINHKGVLGILTNQYSDRRTIDREIKEEIKKFVPLKSFKASIPDSVQCRNAHRAGELYSMFSKKAASTFMSLADEVIKEEELRKNETTSKIVDKIGIELGGVK